MTGESASNKGKSLKRPSSALELPSGRGSGATTPAGKLAATATSLETILSNVKRSAPKTLRETIKKTKFNLCESSETAAHSRMMEQRLRVLSAAMDVREKLNNPMGSSEIPEDLHRILFKPWDSI